MAGRPAPFGLAADEDGDGLDSPPKSHHKRGRRLVQLADHAVRRWSVVNGEGAGGEWMDQADDRRSRPPAIART